MKANELRIGNLIDRQDYICKVTKIEEGGIITEPLEYKGERFVEQRVEPIPLTEEWLVKFGFNVYNKPGGYTVYIKYKPKTRQYLQKIYTFKDCYGWDGIFAFDGSIQTRIKYIHQLQNLYFALTGEELTIG